MGKALCCVAKKVHPPTLRDAGKPTVGGPAIGNIVAPSAAAIGLANVAALKRRAPSVRIMFPSNHGLDPLGRLWQALIPSMSLQTNRPVNIYVLHYIVRRKGHFLQNFQKKVCLR